MSAPTFNAGDEVRYCHEESDRRAQVTEVHAETGEVLGLAVYDGAGNITHGVPAPKPATTPQQRITHGHFWKQ
jgi:hypothetical protein